jgi:hypothetical protein
VSRRGQGRRILSFFSLSFSMDGVCIVYGIWASGVKRKQYCKKWVLFGVWAAGSLFLFCLSCSFITWPLQFTVDMYVHFP